MAQQRGMSPNRLNAILTQAKNGNSMAGDALTNMGIKWKKLLGLEPRTV